MDLSIDEIAGVLGEENGNTIWLKVLDIYRTEDGLVVKVELPKKKKPIEISMGLQDLWDEKYKEFWVNEYYPY